MKKNAVHDDAYTDLEELDRLVTQQINVLQQKNKRITLVKKHQKHKQQFSDSVIPQEDSTDAPCYDNAPHFQESHVDDNLENFKDDQENVIEPVDPHQSEQSYQTELFTEAEQTFIARTTAWLEPRENKDLLMNQIWEQLTDAVPESFYSVKPDNDSGAEVSNTKAPHIKETPNANTSESLGFRPEPEDRQRT